MKKKIKVKDLPEIKKIVEEVVDIEDLSNKSQLSEYVFGRYIFFKIGRTIGYSATQLARFLGKKQHGTVSHAIEKHRLRIVDNALYTKWYNEVLDKVNGVEIKEDSDIPQKILNKITLMTPKQLDEFDRFRLEPYLKSLQIL